jgi:hypothetical protein
MCWEVDNAQGLYIPHLCENCKKIFYLFQRSWFDITYDTSNVEVHDQEWVDKLVKDNKLQEAGTFAYGKQLKPKTKDVTHLYARKYNAVELMMKKTLDEATSKIANEAFWGKTPEFDGLDKIINSKESK